MRYQLTVLCLSLGIAIQAFGHGAVTPPDDASTGRSIDFPDTSEYQTLVMDLHTHSVFSDGHVWPSIRVEEALRDGLDAIAITEHLEWQPHLADIPHKDRNRAYQDAVQAAGANDIFILAGSEITREMPAGHINAIFIQDANKLLAFGEPLNPTDAVANYIKANEWPAQQALDAANEQQAFVFWNHPWWSAQTPSGIAAISKFHIRNIKKGRLQGIEIANGAEYSEEAFKIALKYNLTLVGTSDVHGLIDWDYKPNAGGHRPVTLVFTQEKTPDAIKEALFAGRTVVWFKNILIGRTANLQALIEASLTLDSAIYLDETDLLQITISNHSDADFQLQNKTRYTFMESDDRIEVPAHGKLKLQVKGVNRLKPSKLAFTVMNALTAPKVHPVIKFEFNSQAE